jgi:hypothetical protein
MLRRRTFLGSTLGTLMTGLGIRAAEAAQAAPSGPGARPGHAHGAPALGEGARGKASCPSRFLTFLGCPTSWMRE